MTVGAAGGSFIAVCYSHYPGAGLSHSSPGGSCMVQGVDLMSLHVQCFFSGNKKNQNHATMLQNFAENAGREGGQSEYLIYIF